MMAQRVHAQLLDVEPLDDPSVVQALANEYLLAQQRLLPLDSDGLDGDELDLLLDLKAPSDELAESAVDISTTADKGTVNDDTFQHSQQQGDHGNVKVALLTPNSDDGDCGGDQHGGSTLHSHRSAIDDNHTPPLPVDATSASSGSCFEDEDAASHTQDSQAEQQTALVKVHPRRNRKRRKHEVDALRIEEKELMEKLKQLQAQVQHSARMPSQQQGGQLTVQLRLPIKDNDCLSTLSGVQLSVLKKNKSPPQDFLNSSGIWESLAWFQREEVRASMEENTRLRAFYRDQLLMLKHLEIMAPDQFPLRNVRSCSLCLCAFTLQRIHLHERVSLLCIQSIQDAMTPAWLQEQLHVGGASALATKRARVDPFGDDFAIFASLGRDFDAQYAKTDSILESAGILNFDGRRREEMVPKRGANGIYFLESVFSKKIPRDAHAHDETIWHVLANEQLHAHHGAYEVRTSHTAVILRLELNLWCFFCTCHLGSGAHSRCRASKDRQQDPTAARSDDAHPPHGAEAVH